VDEHGGDATEPVDIADQLVVVEEGGVRPVVRVIMAR